MQEIPGKAPTQGDTGAPQRRLFMAVVASLIVFAILVGYYAGHKPISVAGMSSLLAAVGDLLIATLILGLGGGVGRRLAGNLAANSIPFLVVQAALGLGCLALLILGLLSVGLFSAVLAWGLVALLLVVFGRSSLKWFSSWGSLEVFRPANAIEGAALLAVAVVLGLGLIEAAAPPVHFDALVYHLELPQRFLAGGSLSAPADNPYWGLPLTGEMLYTLAMALGRPQTAAVVGFGAALLACVGVFALASEFGRPAGWASLLALLAGPSLAASSGWAYVDWWAALFGFALIAVVLRVDSSFQIRDAILAGVLAGFAGGVKYTAAIAVPAGFLAIWAALPSRRGLRLGLVFLATGILLLSPWLIKNWVITGSPLHPYLGGGEGTSVVRQGGYIDSIPAPPLAQSLLVPLAATLRGYEQGEGFASDIGPLLAGLLPGLVVLAAPVRRRLIPVTVFLLTGWALWAVASQVSGLLVQTRLYFVLVPAWAILAGGGFLGLAQVSIGSVRLGRLVGALIALVVALGLVQQIRTTVQADPLSAVLGSQSSEEYLTRRLGGTYVAQLRLARLPPASKTLMLWEPRSFYCWPACIPDPWIDTWYVARRSIETPEAILQSWTAQGITHLLLFNAGVDFVRANDPRYSEGDWAALEQLLQDLTPIETIGDGYSLFRIDG